MLDIYVNWWLILTANFLFILWFLNQFLYKPLFKVMDERKGIVDGSLNAAKDMENKKEEAIVSMNREIAEARAKAKEAFESLKGAGQDKQKEVLSEAEASAAATLQKAREELRAEVEKAKQTLKADVEKFSDEIVGKLVKT